MNRTKKYTKILLPIVLVLIAFMAFNVICVSGHFANNGTSEKILSSNNRFVKIDSLEGLEELRASLFSNKYVTAVTNDIVSFEGERWVIVELGGESLYDSFEKSGYDDFATYCKTDVADKLRNSLLDGQNRFLDELSENSVEYTYKYSYTALSNGVALRVDAGAYNVISQMSGVKEVYFSESYEVPKIEAVTNNANVYTTGIYDSKDLGYQGEGMVVAILDTGLDYSHEAFTTMPKNPAWDKNTVATKMANAGDKFNAKATVDEVYYNAKVPFAYDYADDDPDVYPSYSTHGTHVAGIVAGKSDYVVNGATGETFLGVAPEAQLVICKVFTDNLDSDSLGGANSIDILAAVSDCAELGVDVINMSLGSSCGFSTERGDTMTNEVYAKVKSLGISLIVAASNDYSSGFGGGNGTNLASNPDSATVGSPSTYDAAMSVASINGQKAAYIQANNDENQVAFVTTSSDENGNEYKFVEELYKLTGKPSTAILNFKYVVIGGVGRPTNYNGVVKNELNKKDGYDGVIALIKRGDTTFAEKVQAAMDNGADACIIYNNVSGTIRMSLGEVQDPIPTCSIGMDAGNTFVANAVRNIGTIQISNDFMAGPFMSEFSSWGPTPDLQIKPEITAHGGEITSAVPGGYDIYSGTSMAAPNMAGAVALLRQYLKGTLPNLNGTDLTARVNQVLMSTATIALNEEGNPYSPRKQGAGLAGIADAISAESFITVKDADGNVRDKTKMELYDDKTRSGKYSFKFTVNNISGKNETYKPVTYVMTETLASDNKTVAEKAYMLRDSVITYKINGSAVTGNIEIPAFGNVEVEITIQLGSAGRKYIEDCFKNGMFVEGFVSLQATGNTKVTIGLPYLAFYGNWADAPLFDYDTYEIAASKQDTGVPEENKLKASSAATKPLGLYYDDKYIIELGAYLYSMDESEVEIYPTKDKAAVSIYDYENNRTIYEFYMVYAGLLRNARYMYVTITDSATGEVIYEEKQENIRKSYANGGSNIGARVSVEAKPMEWGLLNNSSYIVELRGELDYEGGENPEKNTFDCKFTVDYEAPQLLDYRIRYDSYKDENKQIKYRIYMDVDVYDNQYVMSVLPCYVKQSKNKNVITSVTQYAVPVYADSKGSVNTVSFEITDIYDDYVKQGKMYLAVDDYAMNQSIFQIKVPEGTKYPTAINVATDSKLVDSGNTGKNKNGVEYGIYELQLSPNEVYKPIVSVTPDDTVARSLEYVIDKDVSGAVLVNEEEIFAKSSGLATVQLCGYEGDTKVIYAQFNVSIAGDPLPDARLNKISILPVLCGKDYVVSLEGTLPEVEFYPNQSVELKVLADPWYLTDSLEYAWSSTSTDVVTVDNDGKLTTLKKGGATVTVSVVGNAIVEKSIKIKVLDEYRIVNYTLYDYYGGEICEIPDSKNVMYLDDECFQYNTTLKKIVFPTTLTEIPEYAFLGCENLEEVVIPSQCTVIKKNAFENCTSLKKITFKCFADRDKVEHPEYNGAITIGPNAFKNCTALTTIENSLRITTALNSAFEGCTALEEIDITELRVTGKRVFAGCTKLKNVVSGENTNIGEEMFYNCSAITKFDFYGSRLAQSAFAKCENLTEFNFKSEVTYIGSYVFSGDKGLTEITLPNGNYTIGKGAFNACSNLQKVILSKDTVLSDGVKSPFVDCELFAEYEVNAENQLYTAENGILYNKDKTKIIAVPTYIAESVWNNDAWKQGVTEIAAGAFAGVKGINTLDLVSDGITQIGAYAFAESTIKNITLPTGITVLPEGVFAGCTLLENVSGLDNVTTIESYAFNGCSKLSSIVLESAVVIKNNAFEKSSIATISSGSAEKLLIEEVGDSAFVGSKLAKVDMPYLTKIGTSAFQAIPTLTSIKIGAVTEMGEKAFYLATALNSVEFAEGATLVGVSAFEGSNIISVVLPDTIKTIGDNAFRSCRKLQSVGLSGVTSIGANAFNNCIALENVDLSNVEYIGEKAFAGTTRLLGASLDSAEVVASGAFEESGLREVSFGSLKVLGANAFSKTSLTTVTLPASFDEKTYDYAWETLDDKGRVERTQHRNEATYGKGAFGGIATLTEINVEGDNKTYVSIDGVLYSVVNNGYILQQYPIDRKGNSYVVADETIGIAAHAFEGVQRLREITFPYTVKTIGSHAFYNSSVKRYVFNSVDAPNLLAEYVDGSQYKNSNVDKEYLLYIYFGKDQNCIDGSIFYANFGDYVGYKLYDKMLTMPVNMTFGLTITIPKNGTGYDTPIWSNFFENVIVTEEILPDDISHKAIAAAEKILATMTVEEIMAATTLESLTEISAVVKNARIAYNQITNPEQLNLAAVQESQTTLLAAEKALRDKKSMLGAPVQVESLVLATIPTKIKYTAGESFDPTGMVIKVIFEDSSELEISDYTLDKTVLSYGDENVTISYTYLGKTVKVTVNVNVSPSGNENNGGNDGDNKGNTEEGNAKLATVWIIVIVVGSVLVVAGIAVAVILVLKKQGKLGNKKEETPKKDKKEKNND